MPSRADRSGRRIALIVAVAVVAGGGIGFAAAAVLDGSDGDDSDRLITPATATAARSPTNPTVPARPADRSPDVVVDDAIRAGDARRAISAATDLVDGVALTVDRDDGRYEVEMQRPDATIAEVLVDSRFRALGLDPGD